MIVRLNPEVNRRAQKKSGLSKKSFYNDFLGSPFLRRNVINVGNFEALCVECGNDLVNEESSIT